MDPTKKRAQRRRRHRRLRTKVRGTPERPRLVVYRSNQGTYAQVIDDHAGHTLAAASSLEDAVDAPAEEGKVGAAKVVGRLVAERAREAGVERVVFDRGGRHYHGRVHALADGAREGGLEF